jgi:hypothetical protein
MLTVPRQSVTNVLDCMSGAHNPVLVETAPAGFCRQDASTKSWVEIERLREKILRSVMARSERRESCKPASRSVTSVLALCRRGQKKIAYNPMNQDVETRLGNLRRAPRCQARTRAGRANAQQYAAGHGVVCTVD